MRLFAGVEGPAYDWWKGYEVDRPNPAAARRRGEANKQAGWSLLNGNNCMDHATAVLEAYGVPWSTSPWDHGMPWKQMPWRWMPIWWFHDWAVPEHNLRSGLSLADVARQARDDYERLHPHPRPEPLPPRPEGLRAQAVLDAVPAAAAPVAAVPVSFAPSAVFPCSKPGFYSGSWALLVGTEAVAFGDYHPLTDSVDAPELVIPYDSIEREWLGAVAGVTLHIRYGAGSETFVSFRSNELAAAAYSALSAAASPWSVRLG